jgi:PIN domain nuclease of toxin-antitoxin system
LSETYIFDACSLIALLTAEEGSDIVKNLLQKSVGRKNEIIMHKINLLEVYYDTFKVYSEEKASKLLEDIKVSPISINNG